MSASSIPTAWLTFSVDTTPPSALGRLLVAEGTIDGEELQAALEEQAIEAASGRWELLGTILQRWELATAEQIENSLARQARDRLLAHFERQPHRSVKSALKRVLDIGGALVGLGVTAAVFPMVAIAISLEDGGPVLFRQNRVGLHGRQFGILKFRTMVPDADRRKLSVQSNSQHFFSASADKRVTRVGRLLRDTMLDELPQFWNVLVGEMSLVGTRPPTLDEVWHYEPRHWSRLAVKAGMTGLWQVSTDRHDKSFEDVVELDRRYRQEWSVALDVTIIVRTLGAAVAKVAHS